MLVDTVSDREMKYRNRTKGGGGKLSNFNSEVAKPALNHSFGTEPGLIPQMLHCCFLEKLGSGVC